MNHLLFEYNDVAFKELFIQKFDFFANSTMKMQIQVSLPCHLFVMTYLKIINNFIF